MPTSIAYRIGAGFYHLLRRFSNGLISPRHPVRVLVRFLLRLRKGREHPKLALEDSLWIAFCRCAIHILPLSASGFLIWINYHHFYIADGLSSQNKYDKIFLALYQVASKMHEMLCVASLAVIVMNILRYDLVLGDGVPLGLLGSGISFNQLSYFWSPDFLCAAKFSLTRWRRSRLFLFVLLAGFIAVTVGPSSAVLMLPRVQPVPVGGTPYYLNATSGKLWPNNINSSFEYPACFLPNATEYDICPSGGYTSLRNTFQTYRYIKSLYDFQFFSWEILDLSLSILVQSPFARVPVMISSGQLEWGEMVESYAYQPSAIVVAQQQQLNFDWFNFTKSYPSARLSSAADYKYRGVFSSTADAPFPLVRASCELNAENLSADATTTTFPVLAENVAVTQGSPFQWAKYTRSASIATLNRNFSAGVRAQWVNLPQDTFGPISAGMLVELPWLQGEDAGNTSSRVAIGCALKAAWYEGTVGTSSGILSNVWTVQPYFKQDVQNPRVTFSDDFAPLILDSSWLNTLTPTVLDTSYSNTTRAPTTMEDFINAAGLSEALSGYVTTPPMNFVNNTCVPSWFPTGTTQTDMWNNPTCGKGDKRIFLQAMLAVVVADGLSRYNSILAFNPGHTLSEWTPASFPHSPSYASLLMGLGKGDAIPPPVGYPASVHKLQASFSMTGYAYYASSTTDYLATTVMALYILVGIAHLFWVLLFSRCTSSHKWTSNAWAKVTDLIALCTNSPWTSALRGTSAGIAAASTYATVAHLRVSRPLGEEHEDKQITLLFNNDDGGVHGDGVQHTSLEESLLLDPRRGSGDAKEKKRQSWLPATKKGPAVSSTWSLSKKKGHQALRSRSIGGNDNRIIVGEKYN